MQDTNNSRSRYISSNRRNELRIVRDYGSDSPRAPRSLLRGRPLAEPCINRYQHNPSVGIERERDQQHSTSTPATSTIMSTTCPESPEKNSSSIHLEPFERLSCALPKINEGDTDYCDFSDKKHHRNRNEDAFSDNKKSEQFVTNASQVPPVTFISDNSSVDSFPDFGSQQSNSSCSTEYEQFENDCFDPCENDVTDSTPVSGSLNTNSQQQQQQDFPRQSYSHSSFPLNNNVSSRRRSSPKSSKSVLLDGQLQQHRRSRDNVFSSSLLVSKAPTSIRRSSSTSSSEWNLSNNVGQTSSASTCTSASFSSHSSSSSSTSTQRSRSHIASRALKKTNPKKEPGTAKGHPHHHNRVAATGKQYMVNFLYSGGVILQILVLVFIALLVAWSRSQADVAAETLLRLRKAESLDLLRLHRLEDHSMHVHELIQKSLVRLQIKEQDVIGDENIDDVLNNWVDEETEVGSSSTKDGETLLTQYRQLREMSAQLRKQEALMKLQHNLQEKAANKIVENYGEGSVKVVIELNFHGVKNRRSSLKEENNDQGYNIRNRRRKDSGEKSFEIMAKGTYLSIVLWPDAPHAAWAWLDQIERGVWNGASLEWDPTSTLLQFRPTIDDPADRGHLGFVEHHDSEEESNPDFHHGAWTIGLREILIYAEDDDDEVANGLRQDMNRMRSRRNSNRLEMFVNLSDNQHLRKHETCVGKIFDGFDSLQRLLEATRLTEEGDAVTSVTVNAVTAKHMTNKELEMVDL
mmetsp:Transcript_15384/g.35456  ORF Transcript_15384/g.35456 Transcript_15384/m.35456 type:complete len:747 (+) Transcript_15384:181-2421(+)